jgi:hypothetical protein
MEFGLWVQKSEWKSNGIDRMKQVLIFLIAGVLAAAMAGGCCAKRSENPVTKICVQGVDSRTAIDAAKKTLEAMHFTIEKADANAGYIRTRPLAAGQFFELWRSDTVGCENFAEANLHSVTRIAEINVTSQDGDVCMECSVTARRLSMPQREISNATELPGVFTRSGGGLQTLKLNPEQERAAAWMDMGPDTELQARILERIGKQMANSNR